MVVLERSIQGDSKSIREHGARKTNIPDAGHVINLQRIINKKLEYGSVISPSFRKFLKLVALLHIHRSPILNGKFARCINGNGIELVKAFFIAWGLQPVELCSNAFVGDD